MSQNSWHLDRRTFLRGSGFTLALPMLESMSRARKPTESRPRRLCCTFFANGGALPKEGHPDREDWHWFPLGAGRDHKLTKSAGLRFEAAVRVLPVSRDGGVRREVSKFPDNSDCLTKMAILPLRN